MKLENITYPEQYVCQLTISADAAEFEAAIQANYESKRETLKIKGFEAGQASRTDAETVRGEDFFWYDAANAVLDAAAPAIYDAVVAEHALAVASECEYDLLSVTKADGFVVTCTFCLVPEFVFGDYSKITVMQKSAVVTEAEVSQIVAAQAAQKEVKPELEAEFRVKIREKLEENKRATVVAEAQSTVLMELGALAEGEIPTPMIEQGYAAMLQQLNEMLQQRNATMAEFLEKTGHTKEEFSADTRKGAEKRLRATLALIRLGISLGYTPTAEEVEAEILVRAEQVKGKVKDFAQKADRRRVAHSIIRKQAMEHLLAQVTIIDPDAQ